MDPSRDNPLLRFATFWWGFGTFLIFALLLAVILIFNQPEPTSLEDAAAVPRYATRAKVDAAQAANLSPAALDAATLVLAKRFASMKPVAVEKPAQVIPGSETAKKLAAAPAVDTTAIDAVTPEDGPLSYQTDEQIAGVLTYIRNSFGNKASSVKPEQVAALRSEVGKPQITAAELTKP